MDYNSILELVEEQKKNEQLFTQLYRYSGLVKAIEFFSQKLNVEQIIDAAFDFINELLTLEKSAAFILQGGMCVLQKNKGFNSGISLINGTDLQNLAMHGTVIYDRKGLERYFDAGMLEKYDIMAVIPLIVEHTVFGFIMTAGKTSGQFNQDDCIISEALMRLINNAIENFMRYGELQRTNNELDEKIFNLFAINQSSKILLSELDLETLHKLSADVFSELTQSTSTGFVLYDEKTKNFQLKGFRDIFHRTQKPQITLSLKKNPVPDDNRIIIDAANENDVLYFDSLFSEGMEALKPLKPLYLVFLQKNGKLLGFVTLGSTTTGRGYGKGVFELIESLASATYTAISNARLFKEANDQRHLIQKKFQKFISLTNLIKNINTALKTETLLDLTMKTLEVSFDIKKALIGLFDQENGVFNVTNLLGIDLKNRALKPRPRWKSIFEGKVIYDKGEKCISKYFDKAFARDAGEIDGVLLVPIFVDRVGIELLGIIAVLRYRSLPFSDTETRLTVETIASHIAPVMGNLLTIEEQKRFSLPNYIELFKSDLNKKIREALEFSTKLEVIRLHYDVSFTSEANIMVERLKTFYKHVYPIAYNDIFILNEGGTDTVNEDMLEGLENVSVKRYTLGVDFSEYKDFFRLF